MEETRRPLTFNVSVVGHWRSSRRIGIIFSPGTPKSSQRPPRSSRGFAEGILLIFLRFSQRPPDFPNFSSIEFEPVDDALGMVVGIWSASLIPIHASVSLLDKHDATNSCNVCDDSKPVKSGSKRLHGCRYRKVRQAVHAKYRLECLVRWPCHCLHDKTSAVERAVTETERKVEDCHDGENDGIIILLRAVRAFPHGCGIQKAAFVSTDVKVSVCNGRNLHENIEVHKPGRKISPHHEDS